MIQWLRREGMSILEDVIDDYPLFGWMLAVGTVSFLAGCFLAFVLGCMSLPIVFVGWLLW